MGGLVAKTAAEPSRRGRNRILVDARPCISMTVRYNSIGYTRPFGFARLIFRWHGSIWKAIWLELAIWLGLYYFISFAYRLSWVSVATDSPSSKVTFEHMVLDWNTNNTIVPVTFVLGFYTSIMFTRWWAQFQSIPWIDPLAQALNISFKDDPSSLLMKRSIVRWINLAACLVYQDASTRIKKVYPDLSSLVRLGVLTQEEKAELTESPHDTHQFFLPYSWCHALINKAQDKNMIRSDIHVRLIFDQLEVQRRGHGNILGYGWVAIPLLFTQVASAAVYFHFALALISEQFLDPTMNYPGHETDWGIPFFSMMRIITIVGWLKANELMKHPFGEDEESIEIDWIIRRNLDVGLDIVTRQSNRLPGTLAKDKNWEIRTPGMDQLHQRGRRQQRASSHGWTAMSPMSSIGIGAEGKDEAGDAPLLN